ncbi:MAG TPA: ABC transporter permease [Pseudonocardiaceae bacterium]|jgi:branched-subunit amino acid ABC-type transport system permease component|nr:ABC transporter permease [Pseudonocardiaceae bacterium]
MNTFLNYFVPGISDGSVYALCALGLVLTYKTSGVFNFAYGAQAAVGAYMFYEFHDLPSRPWLKDILPSALQGPYPWPVAFLLGLLIVGVFGGLVMERLAALLAEAPTVMIVVATVGLLVMLQGLMTAIYGAADLRTRDYLPTSGFTLGEIKVSYGDVMVTVFCLVSAFALFAFFGRTRLGKATTAVVDDPNLLSLQKMSPTAVRRLSWVLGSCFATIAGMLLAPKLGVSVNTLVLIVIAAYGAAAIGLFENLPLTVGGAFFIGVLVNYLPSQVPSLSNHLFGKHNLIMEQLPRNTPFIVLLIVFLTVPARKLTERGVRNARKFTPPRQFPPAVTAAGLGLLLFAAIMVPHAVDSAKITQYSAGLGYMIIFLSLGMLIWMSGQISLCHMGFAALGATTMGHLMTTGISQHLHMGRNYPPWPLALLIAGLAAVPFGAIVAIPAIRLAGIYVAVATFGFGIVLQYLVYPMWCFFGNPPLVPIPRPGDDFTLFRTGQHGTTPGIFGVDFVSDQRYYYLCLIVTVLMAAVVLLVRRSRLGQLLRALSDSPVAVETHGANATVMRVFIFCLAAFMAGIGGAMLSGVPEQASGTPGGIYDYTFSLIIVAVLGFCGRRPILSPLLAAMVFEVSKVYPPFDKANFVKWEGVLFGATAILVAVWPALNFSRLTLGARGRERDQGTSPVRDRVAARPVQPVAIRLPELEIASAGGERQS